jgi:hypothetical protein
MSCLWYASIGFLLLTYYGSDSVRPTNEWTPDGKAEGGGSHDIVWLRKIWLKRNSRTFDWKSATLSQETKNISL